MEVTIRLLRAGDDAVLNRVAEDVFDHPINPEFTRAFLADARHHLIVALDGVMVVGMITALDYGHPDKPPQLWINEVGVAPSHYRRGIARQLLQAMIAHGRALGCTEAWVLTTPDNEAACALYASVGGTPKSTVEFSFV